MIFGLDIDVAIFLAYLALNLFVGLKYGRNVKNIKDYALGGRNFTTGALVATIVGTWASGSGFFITLSKVYSDGLYYFIASSFIIAPLLFIGFVFAPRMGEFLGKVSVADVMGSIYGKEIRIITAVVGMIGASGIIAVQFKALGNMFHYFLNANSDIAMVAAGMIMIIFSAFGGIRSITFTDIIQCVTFVVGIPLVGLLIWHQLIYGDTGFSLSAAFSSPKFNPIEALRFSNPKFWEMMPLLLYFLIPAVNPTDCQRVMIGSTIRQIKKAFIVSAFLLFIIKLFTSWIPFLLFSANPNLEPNQLLPYIVDHYTYTGLKSMVIIAVVALAISTADAYMNIASVMFAHDICQPLGFVIHKNELFVARISSGILGVLGIILAISQTDFLSIVLAANGFYMPIVTAPLIATIMGFRSSKQSVLIGMLAGVCTSLIWKILDIKMDCIVVAMCVNCLFLFGSHYILRQPGGWVGIKDNSYLNQEQIRKKRERKQLIQKFKNFTILGFIKKLAPKNELTYSGFGVYCIICTFMTMYLTHAAFAKDSTRTLMYLYQIMLVTGTMMGSFPIWPQSIKKEIIMQIWWPFATFYMLGLFSAFFLMIGGFDGLQFAVFTINAIVALTLVGWRMGSVIVVVGFYLASIVYKSYANVGIDIGAIYSTEAVALYLLLLLGATVVIFLKPKQDAYELSEFKVDYLHDKVGFYKKEVSSLLDMKNEFLRNIEHESRTPITGITSMGQVLHENYDKLSDKQRRMAAEEIAKSSDRLNSWASNLVDLSKLSASVANIVLTQVNLAELIEERLAVLQKMHNAQFREFELNLDPKAIFKCDRYYIGAVIDSLVTNALQYSKEGKIVLSLRRGKQSIEFSISDEGMGIPKQDLEDIFGLFVVSSKTKSPAGGRGVGLALCKKVIEMHGGKIWAESDGENGSVFKFVV